MNTITSILTVPQDRALRNKLLHEVRMLVQKVKVQPPVPFEQMEQLAMDLLKKLGVSEEYINFTIILLGNESWHEIVEATPFNRRLLLLPQCLRNNESCKGVFDELGLNCAACKACPVDDILVKAENLGYATLVAEGTTVAIGLVEEGAIDAVIGVSCMPVLQKSFEKVTNAAVPVIGIPLMFDGCVNTKVDLDWLNDEIGVHEPNTQMQPISISGLNNQIQDFFEGELLDAYFNSKNETQKIAKEYVQIGGQRMRPLIAALCYTAYANVPTDEVLYPLLLVIECFHKASLIHDDIEDHAEMRYNQPTAHKKYGTAMAINIGDYLIGKGYHILAQLPVESQLMAKGLKRVSQSHLTLTEGQGADILYNEGHYVQHGTEEIIQIFKDKTGEAIKVALLLGAIFGKADETELEILTHFSDLFGVSYQIRDDLNEFRAKENGEKISDFPFLSALLYGAEGESDNNEMSRFRRVVLERGLDEKADGILSNYVQLCYNELDKLSNSKLRLSLYSVLGKIFRQSNG
jgi:geranylgeranyl diphosphate synthase type II